MRSHPAAYSVVELMLVIAILLILATVAISGTDNITRNLRLNNQFNKIILITQEARSAAITGKNDTVASWRVKFSRAAKNVRLIAKDINGDDLRPDKEIFTIIYPMDFILQDSDSISQPPETGCSTAEIEFMNGTDLVNLNCEGVDGTTAQNLLRIGLYETDQRRFRAFTIHKAGGIPQVQ